MPPTLTPLPFPNTSPEHFVHIISNLLSEAECAEIIKLHTTNLVPSNVSLGTIRTREQFDDRALADLLWSRISHFYQDNRVQDEDGSWWRVTGLNEHLRVSKYEKRGRFSAHFDSRYVANVNEQSFLAVNVYLNTVPEEHKGATRVLQCPAPDAQVDLSDKDSLAVLAKVQPVLGTASVFRDTLWHDGEELLAGEKYLLRTDVMYEREVEFDFEAIYGGLSDQEKGVKAMGIASALEDGGSREEAVRWYRKALRLGHEL